jgi:predicted site-specific integrase-resolvase
MNNRRIQLDAELRAIVGDNVYFQPPESLKLRYPAIIYKRRPTRHTHADNINYLSHHIYEIVVVDKNPDSEIVEQMNNFRTCECVSTYAKDGLNYTVFELYYN